MAVAREHDGIQVISRAATVLRALANETEGLSLGEITSRVNLARSTVQRIVRSLVDEQFLMPVSERGRVKLGPELIRLGIAATFDIVGLVRPYLIELSHLTGETVDLSILQNDEAIFIDQVAGSHRLSAISQVGTVFPLHSTANGKALLSCLPADRRRKLLDRPLSNDTDATTTDPERLEREIQSVLTLGLAHDLEEHTPGVCAMGVAFLDAFDKPMALSIPVPKTRYDAIQATLGAPLLTMRDKIIERIAGNLPTGEPGA